jgi:hypothetical protein
VAWSALLNPRVKKVSAAADWFIIGGTEASAGSRNAKRLTPAAL